MRQLIIFIGIIFTALFCGAISAYPVYLLLQEISPMDFHRVISKTTLACGLIFSLVYIRITDKLSLHALGFRSTGDNTGAVFLKALVVGMLILVIVESLQNLFGNRVFDQNADLGAGAIIVVLLKAMITGLFAGLIEEAIYRGALFGGLSKGLNVIIVLLITSLVYAAVHFIKYRAIVDGVEINWLTGVAVFPIALFRYQDPVIIDSFITLFTLGLFLGVVRIRTDSIIPCIALHAGIVFALRISYYLTNPVADSPYKFLINKYEPQYGYLATACILVSLIIYLFITRNKPAYAGTAYKQT